MVITWFDIVFTNAWLALMFTMPVFVIKGNIDANKKKSKALEKAKKEGHVVTAYLEDYHLTYEKDHGNSRVLIYRYEWNGKKYRRRFPVSHSLEGWNLPKEETLYFKNNPRKTFMEGDFRVFSFSYPMVYLTIFVILMLISGKP